MDEKNITIYGDGNQTRSFCYIDDLIDGMVRLMNSRDGFVESVNMGNSDEFTMKQIEVNLLSTTAGQSDTTPVYH